MVLGIVRLTQPRPIVDSRRLTSFPRWQVLCLIDEVLIDAIE